MVFEEVIQSNVMKVVIDKSFPSIITYYFERNMINGQVRTEKSVKINGSHLIPEVSFTKVNESTATYQLNFKQHNQIIQLTVKLQVVKNQLWFDVVDIAHDAEMIIETIEFPNLDINQIDTFAGLFYQLLNYHLSFL